MKVGLVIEGGALRSAFTCGVLKIWSEAGSTFPYTVATSSGALCATYFRAGQSEALEAMYGDYFEEYGEIGRLASLKGDHAIDALALLDGMSGNHPVDLEAFNQAAGDFYIATTRADNGDGVFWKLQNVAKQKHLDTYLRAALTYPGQDEAVSLVERRYFDGSIAEPLPVAEALRQGCDHVVVIQTHPTAYTMPRPRLTPLLALTLREAPMLRNVYLLSHLHDAEERRTLHALEQQHRATVIAPVVESTSYRRYGVSRSAASEFYSEGLRLGEASVEKILRLLEAK